MIPRADFELERSFDGFSSRMRPGMGVRDATVHLLLAPFDGFGQPIPAGQDFRLGVAWDCELIEWRITPDAAGVFAVDILRASWDDYPLFTSITGGAGPSLGGLVKASGVPTPLWLPSPTILRDGDTLHIVTTGVPTVNYAMLWLRVKEL